MRHDGAAAAIIVGWIGVWKWKDWFQAATTINTLFGRVLITSTADTSTTPTVRRGCWWFVERAGGGIATGTNTKFPPFFVNPIIRLLLTTDIITAVVNENVLGGAAFTDGGGFVLGLCLGVGSKSSQ
jgi:hypothetical protein